MPKKPRISDYDLCRVGTVAHNRAFTTRELSEYIRRPAKAMVKRLRNEGLLEAVSRGRYFPTKKGWRSIENACEAGYRAPGLRGARRRRRR